MKPGELVDMRAGADLSLHDRRTFNLLIENAWSEIAENKTHRIAISRLRGPTHKGAERVADSVKALMTSLVEVPTTLEGEPAIFATQLLGPTTRPGPNIRVTGRKVAVTRSEPSWSDVV